jgi:hypothetical protein
MAESWSTSRQALVVSEYAFTFSTDRASVAVGAKRTYLERPGLTSAFMLAADGRWILCYRQNPEHSDRIIRIKALLKGETQRRCICSQDTNVVYCRTTGVDNNGPVVLEYPKYYSESTIPPDFDVVFRIFSSTPINWDTFVLSITTSSGINNSYGLDDVNVIDITNEIIEIRLSPPDLLTMIGDTVNVKVFMKDELGRELELNW